VPTLNSQRTYQINQGIPVSSTGQVTLLPAGLTGTRGARRRLVHPDTTSFSPVLYDRNPQRTVNFDNDVLLKPAVTVVKTATSTRVVRFDELEEDVIVTEIWEAAGGLSVPGYFFRQLYEMAVNQPAFVPSAPVYIQWEPRDRTDDVYNVEIVGFGLGGQAYDFRPWVSEGGPNDPNNPGTILTPTDVLDVTPAEILDRPITLSMRIVAKVV